MRNILPFFTLFILCLIPQGALCEKIYVNSNIAIYNDYPTLTFEIFSPKDGLLKSAFVKKPYKFCSSDNNFKIDCAYSSCKVSFLLTSKENFNAKIPFIEQIISKPTCDELVEKIRSASYMFDHGNLELRFLGGDNCSIRYLDPDKYSNQEIDTAFKEFLEYKKAETDKIKSFAGSIKDCSWVKNKLQALVNINQSAGLLWSYPEKNKLKLIDKIYFEKAFRKKISIGTNQSFEIKELLNKYNWFVISKFGKEADKNGWFLVWDQYHDIKFQKMVLKRLEKLYLLGETSKKNYAYLYDSIAVAENNPQKYGTQGSCIAAGQWEPTLLMDAKRVDEFRKEMGLEPMSEYKKRFKDVCLKNEGSSKRCHFVMD